MLDLSFAVEGAEAVTYAATPSLAFKLRISNADPAEQIRALALNCQIRFDVTRRRYNDDEKERLRDLFGEPERWSETLRHMLWTFASANVPAFTDTITVNLPVTCTYDMHLAAVKYFYALEAGEIPLNLLFSGTIFYETADEELMVAQVPWSAEANFKLPVATWQKMMDHYYPNSAWLLLRRDVFDKLNSFKMDRGLATWEEAMEKLLAAAQAGMKT